MRWFEIYALLLWWRRLIHHTTAQFGHTALIWSAVNNHIDCVHLLLEGGVTKEAKDNVRAITCIVLCLILCLQLHSYCERVVLSVFGMVCVPCAKICIALGALCNARSVGTQHFSWLLPKGTRTVCG